MSESANLPTLATATAHGILLLFGAVHYGSLSVEVVSDVASGDSAGFGALAACGLALVAFTLSRWRWARHAATFAAGAGTTVVWALLSDEARASLAVPSSLALLLITYLGIVVARMRLLRPGPAKKPEPDARDDQIPEEWLPRHASADERQKTAEPSWSPPESHAVGVDVVPGVLAVFAGLVMLGVFGFSVWLLGVGAGIETKSTATLAVMGGLCLATIAIYTTTLEPLAHVRDRPGTPSPWRALLAFGLAILAIGASVGAVLGFTRGAFV